MTRRDATVQLVRTQPEQPIAAKMIGSMTQGPNGYRWKMTLRDEASGIKIEVVGQPNQTAASVAEFLLASMQIALAGLTPNRKVA